MKSMCWSAEQKSVLSHGMLIFCLRKIYISLWTAVKIHINREHIYTTHSAHLKSELPQSELFLQMHNIPKQYGLYINSRWHQVIVM